MRPTRYSYSCFSFGNQYEVIYFILDRSLGILNLFYAMKWQHTDTIKDLVRHELLTNRQARDDDRELVYSILAHYGFDYPKTAFFRLPNTGYITRIKRHIQLENPDLRGRRKRSDAWILDTQRLPKITQTLPKPSLPDTPNKNNPSSTILDRIAKWLG